MRIFSLIILIALAICSPPGYNYEELEAKRREREKELNKEVRDCLLKSEISAVFKEKIQENPEENLVKILVENKKSLEKSDKKLSKSNSMVINKHQNNYIQEEKVNDISNNIKINENKKSSLKRNKKISFEKYIAWKDQIQKLIFHIIM